MGTEGLLNIVGDVEKCLTCVNKYKMHVGGGSKVFCGKQYFIMLH